MPNHPVSSCRASHARHPPTGAGPRRALAEAELFSQRGHASNCSASELGACACSAPASYQCQYIHTQPEPVTCDRPEVRCAHVVTTLSNTLTLRLKRLVVKAARLAPWCPKVPRRKLTEDSRWQGRRDARDARGSHQRLQAARAGVRDTGVPQVGTQPDQGGFAARFESPFDLLLNGLN